MIFYEKEVTVVILGISTLLNISVLDVGLKFRSTELELEADIWRGGSSHADHHPVHSNSNHTKAARFLYLTLLSHTTVAVGGEGARSNNSRSLAISRSLEIS